MQQKDTIATETAKNKFRRMMASDDDPLASNVEADIEEDEAGIEDK